MNRLWCVASVALLVACGSEGGTEPAPSASGAPGGEVRVGVDEPFTLAPGESAELGGTGIVVQFLGVDEDSRCPADVTCVWAGNAEVELLLTSVGQQDTAVLSMPQEPRSIGLGGAVLTLEALAPEPVSGDRIRSEDYRATLRLTLRDGS